MVPGSPQDTKKANWWHSSRGDKCKQQILIQSVAWPHDIVSVIREGQQESLVNISTENRKLEWVARRSVYMSVADWPRYTDYHSLQICFLFKTRRFPIRCCCAYEFEYSAKHNNDYVYMQSILQLRSIFWLMQDSNKLFTCTAPTRMSLFAW